MTHDATSPPNDDDTGAGDSEPDAADSDTTDPDAADPDTTDPDLEALSRRLSRLADQLDAPPPLVADLARAAFETRDLDAELAVLTADSDVDAPVLTRAVETATAPRMVSFEAGAVTIELQIERSTTGVTVTGVVHGPVTSAQVETVDRRESVGLDRHGWFRALVVGEQVRVRVHTAAGVVRTAWVLV